MNTDSWIFPARLKRVVDGDSMYFEVDLGFHARKTVYVRLGDIDTAETYGTSEGSEEHELGEEHTAFVQDWFVKNDSHEVEWPFILSTQKDTGKFGRWIGKVKSRENGRWLNEQLIAEYPEVED